MQIAPQINYYFTKLTGINALAIYGILLLITSFLAANVQKLTPENNNVKYKRIDCGGRILVG